MEFIKKHWFPLLITVIIIFIAVVVYRNRSTNTTDKDDFYSGGSSGLDKNKLLKFGDSGAEVKALQELINKSYIKANIKVIPTVNFKSVATDGSFGLQTQNALFELMGIYSISLADAEFNYNNQP